MASKQTYCRFVLIVSLLGITLGNCYSEDSLQRVQLFLNKYCIDCHGPKKAENEKRFDDLDPQLSTAGSIARWQHILDQLNLSEMPPDDSLQPSEKELTEAIEVLTHQLKEGYAALKSTGGKTVARRLNRFELRNTVRDLLYIDDPDLRMGNPSRLVDNNGNGRVENTSQDPFRSFPNDEQMDGLDNIGDRLVMSDFFLRLMLDAAEESIAMATTSFPEPKVETRVFSKHLEKRPKGDLALFSRELYPDYDAFFQRGSISPDPVRSGVGVSANYRMTVELSGVRQRHPWAEMLKGDQDRPFLVNLGIYNSKSRDDHIALQQIEIPGDGRKKTVTLETWIDRQWYPKLSWENGPSDREARVDLLLKKFLPNLYRKPPDRKAIPDGKQFNKAREAWSREMATAMLKHYQGPELRVHKLTLEPLLDQWPPKSHIQLYGDENLSESLIEPLLTQFAKRAFRRPVQRKEILPYLELVQSQLKDKEPSQNSLRIQDLTFKGYVGKWSRLPDFSALQPVKSGKLPSGRMDIQTLDTRENFGIVFEGNLDIQMDGLYEFQLASDDGARMLVSGKKVIEHDGLHGASLKKGNLRLTKGKHPLRFEYFAFGNPNSLKAAWSGPGFRESLLTVPPAESSQFPILDPRKNKLMKALQIGYTAILCSPDFLYLKEVDDQLNHFEIASRLSFFLWSSMPDEQLIQLARDKKLRDQNILQEQVDRMLDDPKSKAFTRHFVERWLRLDKLSESPPELNGPFRIYWDRRMEPQIVAQTDAYFSHVLQQNAPVGELIDSDYTFLNESIATVFYGRKDILGASIRKVKTEDPKRGGLLTQPSVMTATANGVDTSPVIRGVWILDNILGTPPSPPPPDVEPLSPDLRNAKTIREQLAAHRKQEACFGCHRKIDPLGFAFENFDPIGRWRDRYPRGGKNIDASASLSNGKLISGIVDFKQYLATREKDVLKGLTMKLLSYSSGRILETVDRGEVDRIVLESAAKGSGLRDLIKLVVQSRVFLNK